METAITAPKNGAIERFDIPIGLQSMEEVLRWLASHRTPLKMVETRKGRGNQLFYYLRHQYVTEALNHLFMWDWDFRVLRERLEEGHVTVVGELTVRKTGYTLVKMHYGSSEVERYTSGEKEGQPLSIGDNFKGAASDCLKKCASLLGLGSDLSLPIQGKTMKHLHAVGTEVFGDKWNAKRAMSVRAITGGKTRDDTHRADSAWQLLDVEARILVDIMNRDLSAPIVAEVAARFPKQ